MSLVMSTGILIETNLGNIELELDEVRAPKTVTNFLRYVDAGHYSGTIFHRVIAAFMAQGGGYDERYEKKPTNPPVENEADNGLKNTRGTVAMARTSDPHSATAQFFVNLVDNTFLNHTAKTGSGSTIRIDRTRADPKAAALFFHCRTDLVARFREIHGDTLRFDGNRAIVIAAGDAIDEAALGHCIAIALTYRADRKRRRG